MRATSWLSKRVFTAILTASKDYARRTKDVRSVTQDLSVIVGPILVKAHIVTINERETGPRNLVILAIVLVMLSFMAGVSVSVWSSKLSSRSYQMGIDRPMKEYFILRIYPEPLVVPWGYTPHLVLIVSVVNWIQFEARQWSYQLTADNSRRQAMWNRLP